MITFSPHPQVPHPSNTSGAGIDCHHKSLQHRLPASPFPGQPASRLDNSLARKLFSIFNLNLLWCKLRPLLLVLLLAIWEKMPAPSSAQPPFRELEQVIGSPPASFPPEWTHPAPCSAPHQSYSPDPSPALFPSLDMLQCLNILFVVRGPKLSIGFEVWSHHCQVQGVDHCPDPDTWSWSYFWHCFGAPSCRTLLSTVSCQHYFQVATKSPLFSFIPHLLFLTERFCLGFNLGNCRQHFMLLTSS